MRLDLPYPLGYEMVRKPACRRHRFRLGSAPHVSERPDTPHPWSAALRRGLAKAASRVMHTPDLQAGAPAVTDYACGDRRARFVAMQHIASPAFYAAAAGEVRRAKEDGYVHFYEWVDLYELDETGQRKIRRLTQVLPMPDVYAHVARELGRQFGLELVAQDNRALLGLVNDRDVCADVSPQEFLRRVEDAVGEIELRPEDLETPLTEPVSDPIPQKRWIGAVLDSRNGDLAEAVHGSGHERIVITFGAAHEPGWLAEMRRRDPAWAPA